MYEYLRALHGWPWRCTVYEQKGATYQHVHTGGMAVLDITESFMKLSWLPVHKNKTKTTGAFTLHGNLLNSAVVRHTLHSRCAIVHLERPENQGGAPQLLPPGPQWKRTETTLDAPHPPNVMPGNRSPRNFSNLHDSWLPLSFRWRGAQSCDRLTIFITSYRSFSDVNHRLNDDDNVFVSISF